MYQDEIDKIEAEVTEEVALRPITISELLTQTFDDVEWIVDGLIPAESIVILSGQPACYKTWILLEFAIQIAQGLPVFKHFDSEKTGVLIVDEESGARLLQKRIKSMWTSVCGDVPIHILSYANFSVKENTIEHLIRYSQEKGIGLVIFDSLVRIHKSDENDASGMSRVFSELRRFNKANISVLLAHHHRKRSKDGIKMDQSQEMRGSSDILAAVDSHVAVTKRDGHVVMQQTKMRYREEVSPFKVNIISENESFAFEYGGEIDEINDKKSDFKAAIMAFLEGSENLLYKGELYALLKKNGVSGGYSTYKAALGELVEKERVFTQKGEGNKTFCSVKPFGGEMGKAEGVG